MPSLKDVSKSIFDIVNKIVIENNEITNTNNDKKYLLMSDMSILVPIKDYQEFNLKILMEKLQIALKY